jgi:hypothetical protein
MPGRMVKQRRHRAFRGRQIAAPERDQARGLKRVAQRECVVDRPRIINVALSGPQSLIGESLQPEDPRQDHTGRYLLVVLKTDGLLAAREGRSLRAISGQCTIRTRGQDHQDATVGPGGIPQCWRSGMPGRLHIWRTHPADLHPRRAQGDLRAQRRPWYKDDLVGGFCERR